MHQCTKASHTVLGTLTIRLDDNLDKDLARLAKIQHRTKSDLAREMLRKHIAVEQFRELRRKAMPAAERAGYLTDDDVFRDCMSSEPFGHLAG